MTLFILTTQQTEANSKIGIKMFIFDSFQMLFNCWYWNDNFLSNFDSFILLYTYLNHIKSSSYLNFALSDGNLGCH